MKSMVSAASMTGPMTSIRYPLIPAAQVNRGTRRQAMPGARMLWSVTTRLTEKQTNPSTASAVPTTQVSTPAGVQENVLGQRRQGREPRLGGAIQEAPVDRRRPDQVEPKREQVESREGDPSRADLERHDVGDQPEGKRDREQDHRSHAECGHEAVEDLRLDGGVLGDDQLHSEQHEPDHRDGGEEQGGAEVEEPHRLVVGGRGALDPDRVAAAALAR